MAPVAVRERLIRILLLGIATRYDLPVLGKTVVLGVGQPGAMLNFSSFEVLHSGKSLTGALFGGLKLKDDIPILLKRYMNKVSPLFSLDDDMTRPNSEMALETSDLLTVDQLLESVTESAQQVGRMSVCNAPNMSFLEMTNHFEELGVGKQTKMSNVMGMQHKPVYQNVGVQLQAGNPYMEQSAAPATSKPVPDATSFRLIAASPYDNFLQAARS